MPGVHFGIVAGRLMPDGTLVADLASNETEGSDRSPGFHAVHDSLVTGGGAVPMFGYYAGPAATITGTLGSRPVTARQAVWSEDTGVVVFWFEPAGGTVTNLVAVDAAGNRLPAGDVRVASG
jgi:hypothetical protein